MTQAAELATRIVVLQRTAGYLRLELPAEICSADHAEAIERHMRTLPGITQATLDTGWQQLYLRHDARTDAASMARHLFALLGRLGVAPQTAAEAPADAPIPLPPADAIQQVLERIKASILPARPAAEGSLQARIQPIVESALTEKAITNFFNDIVAFYLIKVHWDLITKRWLQTPLLYSNAWLTTFYLIFLLVRYRKTSLAK